MGCSLSRTPILDKSEKEGKSGERNLTFVMQIGFLACKCMIKMIRF